jgi:excisionase family DNA binding protein
MHEVYFTPSTKVLRGMDEIASYLRVHRRTALRWVHDYALPAGKITGSAYVTTTSLIDLWILAVCDVNRAHRNRAAHAEDTPLAGSQDGS